MKIIIYTTPECPLCHQAKDYFVTKKISFKEIDVSVDPKKAQEMVELSGQTGVPVIDIGGNIVTGFDREKIASLITNHN